MTATQATQGGHRVFTCAAAVAAIARFVSKPVNLSGLEVELLNTLRMRNIYAFIFVSARYQIYIFGPLKLIIMLPHTKTALRDKGSGRGRVRAGERERGNAMNTKCGAAFGFGFAAQRQPFLH